MCISSGFFIASLMNNFKSSVGNIGSSPCKLIYCLALILSAASATLSVPVKQFFDVSMTLAPNETQCFSISTESVAINILSFTFKAFKAQLKVL